ncbi:MAG TPA: DVUA0089 family protein [Planctomycetota bacterium]|nr:DVUA0089 family protein [Planctomycetota bacterium]
MTYSRILFPFSLLGTALMLPSQVWTEAGDARELPVSAQAPIGSGALTQINGVLAANDADMYIIEIRTPTAFKATTVGGASIDTQLSLFNEGGRGVTFNDDSIGLQSTLTSAFVLLPGRYYLAVSEYDRDPLSRNGQQIWSDTPYGVERRPDGPVQTEEIDSWGGSASGGGSYSIFLAGCAYPARQLVLPDIHNLCESPTQLGNSGSTDWWRNSAGRFQVIYDSSHFTGTGGVAGPIVINRLMFRGEDGEPNVGGKFWTGVTVEIGSTSITPATMSATFATNRAAATTTMGPLGTTGVTVERSLGTTPNNYNIIIDLAAVGASFTLDPTSAQPNLLVDIMCPVAPTVPVQSGIPMAWQDALGGTALVRGAGVNTATPVAPIGTLSAAPPVIGVEFVGGGGDSVVIPARNEYYGFACGGSHSAFYETFLQGQDFDLAQGLRLTPDNVAAPNFYNVTKGAGTFDATKVNAIPNTTGDEALLTHALGFTLNYPGASTTVIKPCVNGFVWLDAAMTGTDPTTTPALFLGSSPTVGDNGPRLAMFHMDLHAGRNTATHPNSGLHVLTDTSGGPGNAVAYVTWLNVGIFNSVGSPGAGGHVVHQMQAVFFEATGVIEMRYGTTLTAGSNASASAVLVGFSRGRVGGVPSSDPQSRDLSVETPFATAPEVTGVNAMGQTAVATPDAGGAHYSGRMFGGQSITWNANNVVGQIGAQLIDLAATRPALQMPTITAPDCGLSVSADALLWQVFVLPPSSVVGTVPLVVPPGFEGTEIYAQFVVLDGLISGPDLITRSSNALKHIIGLD